MSVKQGDTWDMLPNNKHRMSVLEYNKKKGKTRIGYSNDPKIRSQT